MSIRVGGFLVCGIFLTSMAHAQTADPFTRPPPSQSPQAPAPRAPGLPIITIDMLVRQGFEVKALERTSEKASGFVVILQRSGEIRSCLMQITRDANRELKRDSVCF